MLGDRDTNTSSFEGRRRGLFGYSSQNHSEPAEYCVSRDKEQDMISLSTSCSSFSSTASSLTADECERDDPSPSVSQRTIFPDFWRGEKRNSALTNRTASLPIPMSRSLISDETRDGNKENDNRRLSSPNQTSLPNTSRRNIFRSNTVSEKELSKSLPSTFHSQFSPESLLRKGRRMRHSTSDLLPTQKPCLRPVQVYSSPDFKKDPVEGRNSSASGRPILRSSDSTVSFSAQVDVYEFARTQENFAEVGWSKNFA